MMNLHIGDYAAPKTLEEAFALLADHPYRIGCGCTDLFPQLRDGKWPSIDLLDLRYLASEFSGVAMEDNILVIGAMATHDALAANELIGKYLPTLAEACAQIGSAQVRKRATIGGNILNASPAADTVPTLIAADASIELRSADGARNVKLNGFAKRPGLTDIRPDEILTRILVPVKNGPWTGIYYKVGPRNAMTISVADAAVLHNNTDGYRIACGSVAATVVRASATEALFNSGSDFSKEDLRRSMEQDISPIDDVRASGSYRMRVLVNLLDNFRQYER